MYAIRSYYEKREGDGSGRAVFRTAAGEAVFRLKNELFLILETDIAGWPKKDLEQLFRELSYCACRTRTEELEEIFLVLNTGRPEQSVKLLKEIPRRIRMIAHKKTRDEYFRMIGMYEDLRNNFV